MEREDVEVQAGEVQAEEVPTVEAVPYDTVASESEIREQIEARMQLERKLKSGAGWFYWIAALSVINSVIALANGSWSFLFGLGATQLVDGIVMGIANEAADMASVTRIFGFGLILVISGLYVAFGWLANRAKRWAFIVGMVLYAFDAVIMLMVSDFLGIAFHAWVLFGLFGGMRACAELNAQVAAQKELPSP